MIRIPKSIPSVDKDAWHPEIRLGGLWRSVKTRLCPPSNEIDKVPKFIKSVFLYLFTLLIIPLSWAQETKRPYLLRSTLGEAGFSVTTSIEGRSYAVETSVGQASAIGTFYGIKYSAIQGFIQPYTFAVEKEPLPLSNLLVTIFPNPFSEELNISFSKQIKGTVEVEVYDMIGRTVFLKTYPAEQAIAVRFNPSFISNYLLKITYKNQAYLKKITRK